MFSKTGIAATLALAAGLMTSQIARAQEVQVGYADNIRPSPFFPVPWQGDPGVQAFLGADNGGYFDAGAIRIINNTANPILFTAAHVDSFGDGADFNIWTTLIGGGISINPGMSVILTQTNGYNFDSSDDQGSNPNAIPMVHLTLDGQTYDLADTAQVLNTEGTDHLAQAGLNESHQWRDIGTFGGQAGVPEPGALAMLGGMLVSSAGWLVRRRRAS